MFFRRKGIAEFYFIPPSGTYKVGTNGFEHNKENENDTCPQGKVIPFKKVFLRKRTLPKKEYSTLKQVCVGCQYDHNA